VANGLPVIAVNRVGTEPDWTGVTGGIEFWGQSFVAGPQGEVLLLTSSHLEENVVVEIDKQRTEDVRRIWPFFRDRRIDFYGGLTQRYID
jgi:N-carbamoylputrescine amidase